MCISRSIVGWLLQVDGRTTSSLFGVEICLYMRDIEEPSNMQACAKTKYHEFVAARRSRICVQSLILIYFMEVLLSECLCLSARGLEPDHSAGNVQMI